MDFKSLFLRRHSKFFTFCESIARVLNISAADIINKENNAARKRHYDDRGRQLREREADLNCRRINPLGNVQYSIHAQSLMV